MSVRFTLTNLLLGTAVVLPISVVSAADQFFREDTNQDGVLSGREAKDLLVLDEDKDREISQAEFTAAAKKQRAQAVSYSRLLFYSRDTNQDRRLSGMEMAGAEHFDQNGDSRLSQLEFKIGLVNGGPSIKDASAADIRKIATDQFSKLDTNEDGRVSGTEAEIAASFDRDQDGLLTKEEYTTGLILCAEVADSLSPADALPNTPVSNDEVHKAYATFITVLDENEKVDLIQDWLHDSIKYQIDPLILDYALKHAKKSHGFIGLPPMSEVRIATVDGGDIQAEADLKCKKGKMKLILRFKEGRMNGFMMDSPEMLAMDKALYRDLQKDDLKTKFKDQFGFSASLKMLDVLDGKDVLSSVHPSVVEQVGGATFEKVFEQFRTKVGTLKSHKLESFETESGENEAGSFTVTHIVIGEGVPQRFTTTYQLAGMEAVIVGFEVADAPDYVPAPEPTPQPEGPSVAELSATWPETVSKKDGLAFKAPSEGTRTEQDSPGGRMTRFIVEQPEKMITFEVELTRLKVDVSKQPKAFFDTAKATLLETTDGQVLQEEVEHEKGPFPSQLLVVKRKDGRLTVRRSLLDGRNFYSFQWTGPESNENKSSALAFHESVKLIDAEGALRSGFKLKDLNGDGQPNSEGDSNE